MNGEHLQYFTVPLCYAC